MGKKYIIELPENTHWIQWIIEGTKDHHPYMDFKQVEYLTPYTEPDIEQVGKEAYDKGYHNGNSACYETAKDLMEKKKIEAYQRGLTDAWEAARKIGKLDTDEQKRLFGCFGIYTVAHEFSAHEAIDKIRQYEQEQEYRVGDEFEIGDGQKFIVLKMDGKEIDRYIDGDGKTYVMKEKYRVMRKTGRHFPEIATVLEKMRGEQE